MSNMKKEHLSRHDVSIDRTLPNIENQGIYKKINLSERQVPHQEIRQYNIFIVLLNNQILQLLPFVS